MKNLLNSKRTLLLLIVLLIVSITLSAQDTRRERTRDGNGQGRPELSDEQIEKMIDHLDEELTLTDDQKVKVTKLFKTNMNDMKILREDESGSREEKRAQMESLKKSFEKKMNSILTPDQQEKFKEMQKNRDQKNGPRGNRRG